ASSVADAIGTVDDRLARAVENDVKENSQDRRKPQQAEPKNLAQGRFHEVVSAWSTMSGTAASMFSGCLQTSELARQQPVNRKFSRSENEYHERGKKKPVGRRSGEFVRVGEDGKKGCAIALDGQERHDHIRGEHESRETR